MRGTNVTCILQKPTQSASLISDSGKTTWESVVEFNAAFWPVSAQEKLLYNREATESIYRLLISYWDIGDKNAAEMNEKNRIVILNTRNQLSPQTFDIIGVEAPRIANKIRHFELTLRETI